MRTLPLILLMSFFYSGFGQTFYLTSVDYIKKHDAESFLRLFKETETPRFHGLAVLSNFNPKEYLYNHNYLAGYVDIKKINDSTFCITGSTYMPVGNQTIASIEIVQHFMKFRNSKVTIERNESFKIPIQISSSACAELLKTNQDLKRNKSFTDKDWTMVSDENKRILQNMVYELMLAALNGSKEALELFKAMPIDFSVVNEGSLAEEYTGCEIILKEYMML